MALQVLKGKQEIAPKVMITGLSGAGKSTLASTLPDALFLDIEGGLSFLDVARIPIETADDLMQILVDLGSAAKNNKREYKYIVIDSVDWLVNLFVRKVTGSGQGQTLPALMESATMTLNKAQGGYGNGKQVLGNFVKDVFINFLTKLNRCGYGIVLIAHAEKKSLMDADGINIDRIAPKMDINSMNVLVEWVDNLFYIKRDDDGEHRLVVNPTDAIMAKNRIGISQDEFVVNDEFDLHKLITGKAQVADKLTKD